MEKPTMDASRLPTARRPAAADTRRIRTRAQMPFVLGRYSLHHRLGAGAFGTVWMARDERLDRDVAVKIVPRERIVGGRFEREARAAARLAHPGIVTLYEAAIDDDGAYLVSELVTGATLAELLDAGRLSDRDIVAIAIALCDALSHAHAEGVVHRDVKPSNVLIPERPVSVAHPAKLTDFGVARVLGGDSLTRTGDVVGTAAYMAPEQAEGREAGSAADLYALALVVYESLTGVNPVRTGTAAMRARRLGAYLPPLRRQRRDLPRELGRGVDLALRPRPRERGSIAELRDALAVSLAQLRDTPGVVTSGLRRPTRGFVAAKLADPSSHPLAAPPPAHPGSAHHVAGLAAGHPLAADPGPHPTTVDPSHPLPSWFARGLAGTAAGATTGWLAAHLLAPSPIPALAAGILAGALVLARPRLGWLGLTLLLAVTATVQHRPGGALLIVAAALIPVVLLPRHATAWPLSAAAPALGLIGLAGAWPALAGRAAGSAWRRAALGLIGWVWLVLAAPLAGVDLYTRRPPGTPSPEIWAASLNQTVDHVLGPLLRSGALAAAPVWALAAVVLPWLLSGRSLGLNVVLVVAWSAAVVSATGVAIELAHGPHAVSTASTAVLGAVAGAVVALAPALLRGWRTTSDSASSHLQVP